MRIFPGTSTGELTKMFSLPGFLKLSASQAHSEMGWSHSLINLNLPWNSVILMVPRGVFVFAVHVELPLISVGALDRCQGPQFPFICTNIILEVCSSQTKLQRYKINMNKRKWSPVASYILSSVLFLCDSWPQSISWVENSAWVRHSEFGSVTTLTGQVHISILFTLMKLTPTHNCTCNYSLCICTVAL